MRLTPDLFVLIATGVASSVGTVVLLLLYRRFKTVVAASWAMVLGVIAANDFLQLLVGAIESSAQSRWIGTLQVVIGHMTAASFLVAVAEPDGVVVRWRRTIYLAAPVVGVFVAAMLLWTEPIAMRDAPGAWYRAAANPFLRVYFFALLLSIAVRGWFTAVRLRSAGRLLIAIGVSLVIFRPFLLSILIGRAAPGLPALLTVTVAVAAMVIILHYGVVIEVMDEKLRLDVDRARRAELAVRNEQLGLMAEGIAGEVAGIFRGALERTRALRAAPTAATSVPAMAELEASLHQGIALSEDLRAFASGDRSGAESIDLTEHVRSHGPMLHWVLGTPHELTCDVDAGALLVRITPVRATHILTDLMHHARGRASDGRPLRVGVRAFARELTHSLRVGTQTLPMGVYAMLVVSIEGPTLDTAPVAAEVSEPGSGARTVGALALVTALMHDAGGAVGVSRVFGASEEVVECWFPLTQPGALA